MNVNPSWKDWFVFSKKERNAFAVLLAVIVVFCLAQAFYTRPGVPVLVENLDQKLAGLSVESDSNNDARQDVTIQYDGNGNANSNASYQLFAFNPNTLDEAGFRKLGLRDKVVRTIINYRTKGGHFYKPDDLRKIYGLRTEEADRLMPYINIGVDNNTAKNENRQFKNSDQNSSYNKPKPHTIEINTATVEEWKALPAIGDALSNRIVKYRDKIGGFASVEDVRKTYGLSDSAYHVILPYLTLSAKGATASNTGSSFKKINLNTASAAELKANPDIPSEVAEAIVIYRRQHGNYASVSDIKKIIFINETLYQKVAPFLTVE